MLLGGIQGDLPIFSSTLRGRDFTVKSILIQIKRDNSLNPMRKVFLNPNSPSPPLLLLRASLKLDF